MKFFFSFSLGFLVTTFAFCCFGETVADREGAVRNDRTAMENDKRWIYNDFQKGFAEAKRTGKPLLVVLRCVPCLACSGIDTAVLLQETELTPLLDQFICVRVINANALDLARFQFDYDLSFSTLFFNADGTVYGRYGSWTHQKNSQDKTTASYRLALEGALAIHKGYPANRDSLALKQGTPIPFKTPVEMPSLMEKYTYDLNWSGKVVQSCVHCHQIGEAFRLSYRDKKQKIPTELIYPMPPPETIGFTLAPDRIAEVTAIEPGSSAEKAGLKKGDNFVSLAGQPLLSIADVSWVLHRSPEEGSLEAIILRSGKEKKLNLALAKGWRRDSDISKRVGTWSMRGMAAGGMVLENLSAAEKKSRGIADPFMALRVKSVGQYGIHAAAKNAGFQKEDVIIKIDGMTNEHTEGRLLGDLLQDHLKGEKVKATVLRGEVKVELELPMQ
ncbi:MAG: serine endoprotease [Verrucomicrobiales bacterium]|nr:serine endoprotease [Verrucomicrobiales bacterium]